MIKLLIVDDSSIIRDVLKHKLSKSKEIEVIGTASNPYIARDILVTKKPDVMTLDINMPRMDGLTFLKKVMKHFPTRVIIVSSASSKENAIKALSFGAFDIISKPTGSESINDMITILIKKIYLASKTPISVLKKESIVNLSRNTKVLNKKNIKVIAIGASTGGTVALEKLIKQIPQNLPGIVIVQHMPENFTASFAQRLNTLTNINIVEAKNGDTISSGNIFIIPGNMHGIVSKVGGIYKIFLKKTPPVFHQRPSVEVLFNSVAQNVGSKSIGVILTGMGEDGSMGLKNMRDAGAYTIAQDEATSVVWGMPGKAVKYNGACDILPLQKIIPAVINHL